MVKNFIICTLCIFIFVSCKRAQQEGGSSISIQIPTAQQFKAQQSKLSAVKSSAIDYSLLCFGVNVKGPGIDPIPAGSCKVEQGITSDQAVKDGGTLTIDVPKGQDRVFEVYGFLRSAAGDACPTTGPDWNWPVNKIYLLGTKSGVTLLNDSESVAIDITLPDESQNIAIVKAWPASCTGNPVAASGAFGQQVAGANSLSSASFHLRARVTERNLGTTLTGTPSGWKFKGRINEQ